VKVFHPPTLLAPFGVLRLIQFRRNGYSPGVETSPPILEDIRSPVRLESRPQPATVTRERPASDWEEPDCPLCGRRRRQVILRAFDNAAPGDWHRYEVVRCLDCQLCFTSPRPSPELIRQYYPAGYGPHALPLRNRRSPWWSRLAARSGLLFQARKALPWHGQGRLLDFGCGGGSFLQRMHGLGWRVTGVDISPVAVDRICGQLGLHALVGSLPHPELPPQAFDVVTMWHSLEHVHDPLEVLRGAHGVLTARGRLLVAVPNFDSLAFRWFGENWFGLDLPRHLTHFTPNTLSAMLERAGFRVRNVRMVRHSHWLRRSAAIARQERRLPWRQQWTRGKVGSRMISSYAFLTRQSECMLVTAER